MRTMISSVIIVTAAVNFNDESSILEIQDGYYLVEPVEGSAESYPAQITKVYSIRVAE